jgi:hypothetical protein
MALYNAALEGVAWVLYTFYVHAITTPREMLESFVDDVGSSS